MCVIGMFQCNFQFKLEKSGESAIMWNFNMFNDTQLRMR